MPGPGDVLDRPAGTEAGSDGKQQEGSQVADELAAIAAARPEDAGRVDKATAEAALNSSHMDDARDIEAEARANIKRATAAGTAPDSVDQHTMSVLPAAQQEAMYAGVREEQARQDQQKKGPVAKLINRMLGRE